MSVSKCIVILSEKSSGSSACQDLLAKFSDIHCVTKTRHFQNETLYWTKAASILALPQSSALDSEVPIPPARAKTDLIALLRDNLDDYSPPRDDKDLIFGGWAMLCEKYAPIFLEKSPHHLFQWSAVTLILDCMKALEGRVDFLLVGLIRNPMDTIYSQFRRWRTRPEQLQEQWFVSYSNLRRLQGIVGRQLVVVRYEDMVSSLEPLQPVFDFCEVEPDDSERDHLHRRSLLKWKGDPAFGFTLSEPVCALARSYGYRADDLTNASTRLWPMYRELARATYKSQMFLMEIARRVIPKA